MIWRNMDRLNRRAEITPAIYITHPLITGRFGARSIIPVPGSTGWQQVFLRVNTKNKRKSLTIQAICSYIKETSNPERALKTLFYCIVLFFLTVWGNLFVAGIVTVNILELNLFARLDLTFQAGHKTNSVRSRLLFLLQNHLPKMS